MNVNPVEPQPEKVNWYNGLSHIFRKKRTSGKTKTASYSKMMQNRIAKRRAKNKVAYKSKRLNQIKTQNKKHVRFIPV